MKDNSTKRMQLFTGVTPCVLYPSHLKFSWYDVVSCKWHYMICDHYFAQQVV